MTLNEEDVFLSERKVGPASPPLPPQESTWSAVSTTKRPGTSAACTPCGPCTCHITVSCDSLCILVAFPSAEVWLKCSSIVNW